MLARLEELEGIERAETDFAGEFLRLAVGQPSALVTAIELLAASGYGAEEVADASIERWYDRGSVGELSRVEAGVIAGRVITALRRTRPLDDQTAATLRSAVVDALHRCFTQTVLGAQPSPGLRANAVGAVRDAATTIVGDTLADELARLVEADMSTDHKPQHGGIIRL
ncbi:MAG: hypothetical protein AAB295_11255 [Chloroflexota bacterium]